MEFYEKASFDKGSRFVSIPNGMEFYPSFLTSTVFPATFQFPTGWNSTFSFRDVFVEACWFQFPTGWNSTQAQPKEAAKSKVSIPNGMEFYTKYFLVFDNDILFQFPTGWNSTYWVELGLSEADLFQFPTGWNSTQKFLTELLLSAKVSIPNGMEFYPPEHTGGRSKDAFQFPTGWNSTSIFFQKQG